MAAALQTCIPVVAALELQGKQVQEVLSQNLVISHRDLDPKNVLWHGEEALVIDWEAAGYVNPYQELLEVINYWADDVSIIATKPYI